LRLSFLKGTHFETYGKFLSTITAIPLPGTNIICNFDNYQDLPILLTNASVYHSQLVFVFIVLPVDINALLFI